MNDPVQAWKDYKPTTDPRPAEALCVSLCAEVERLREREAELYSSAMDEGKSCMSRTRGFMLRWSGGTARVLMRDEGALEGDLYSRYVLLQSQLDTALMLVERLRDRLSHYGENV
jgi:hypothetical protein